MTKQDSVPPAAYLMEHAGEGERLEQKTDREQTLEQLKLVGFPSGSKVLDAGAGTGAVARVMAELVGPSGMVYALDQSKERLEQGQALASTLATMRFVQGDLLNPPFEADSFDLVWCRFVLQHLPAPEPAVKSLASLVRPGGKLVLGDLDGHGLRHYPISETLQRNLVRLEDALRGRQDPYMGRKLYNLCYREGLSDIRVYVLPYHLYAGPAPASAIENWRTKLAVARPAMLRVFDQSSEFDSFVEEFLDLLRDPGTFTYSSLILTVGTKRDGFRRTTDSSD